jgi:hypothetical protein
MKEAAIDGERAVVTHYQAPVVPEPSDGALDDPAALVPPKGPAILSGWPATVPVMRRDQLDSSSCQPLPQRIAVVATVGDDPLGFLSRATRTMSSSYPDRVERRLGEPDFRRGGRVKVVSQRKTRAVDHHHPLRAFPPAGFAHSRAPFLAGAKLPSRNDSLHCNCWRSLSSLRNARQISSQTSCSSQSRSRRQHVEGCGNSSGRSCQRAPLRRIHKMPSSTLRSLAGGRPPCGRLGRFGSRGRIFSHCTSASSRPYRGIGPPPGAALPFYRYRENPTMAISKRCTQFCNWF